MEPANTITSAEYRALMQQKTTRKYRNNPTTIDGITFDSAKEAQRYGELKLLSRAGTISHLELQPEFPLIVNEQKVGKYIADFKYFDNERQKTVVEDVKSDITKTPVYLLKKKLVQALYGIIITEV